MNTTNCTECGASGFYLIEARGPVKNMCLDCGGAWMRDHGHQNDPAYAVD